MFENNIDESEIAQAVETTSIGALEIAPATEITFWPENEDRPICILSWEGGKLHYKGEDIDESTKAFFEFLKPVVDSYIADQLARGSKS